MSDSPPTIADWGELRFLEWVRSMAGDPGGEVGLSVGDDAAVLRIRRGTDVLVTTDALIEGVHFNLDWTPPSDLGAKALAVNLSDIAAMGGRPVGAFLSLGVPRTTLISDLQSFFGSLIDEGRVRMCPLAGGDLVCAPQWFISVTVMGRPVLADRIIRRYAARPGDAVYITGCPGESAAGLEALRRGDSIPELIGRHNRPTPRLTEAQLLVHLCDDLAMMDVSDGIMNDAAHLSRESGVQIELDLFQLPFSPAVKAYARQIGVNPVDWILFGGEDYELLFTTSQRIEKIRESFASAGLETPVTRIGRVVAGEGVRVIGPDGKALPLADKTFKHFA